MTIQPQKYITPNLSEASRETFRTSIEGARSDLITNMDTNPIKDGFASPEQAEAEETYFQKILAIV